MDFSEWQDSKNIEFKALIPKYYPKSCKKYIKEETELLKKKIKKSDKIIANKAALKIKASKTLGRVVLYLELTK